MEWSELEWADILILLLPIILFLGFWGVPYLLVKPIRHLLIKSLVIDLLIIVVPVLVWGVLYIFWIPYVQLLNFFIFYITYLPVVKKAIEEKAQ